MCIVKAFSIISFILLIQFIPGKVAAQTELLTYTNVNYGFTIKYPADWNVDDSNITGMGVLFGKKPQGDVQVVRVSDSDIHVKEKYNITLEHDIRNTLVPMQANGFRLIELNSNTYFLSGHPAVRVVGIQHEHIEMMMTSIRAGGYVYTVKYLSNLDTYLTYLPIAEQMLNSFQVVNAG